MATGPVPHRCPVGPFAAPLDLCAAGMRSSVNDNGLPANQGGAAMHEWQKVVIIKAVAAFLLAVRLGEQ